jgi:hypothetical protein
MYANLLLLLLLLLLLSIPFWRGDSKYLHASCSCKKLSDIVAHENCEVRQHLIFHGAGIV